MLKKELAKKIDTFPEDEFLYVYLTRLLEQIKTLRGPIGLDQTLKNHDSIRIYLMSKQIDKIRAIELKYFNDDGTLKQDVVNSTYLSKSDTLHKI